jgi:hypothetical protein
MIKILKVFFENKHHFLQTCFKFKYLIKCTSKLSINQAVDKLFSYIFRTENKISVHFFSDSTLGLRYTGLF